MQEVHARVWKCPFCENTENAVKINNTKQFTAFTAKRCKKYAVKISFFFTASHRNSYENSPLNLDPGTHKQAASLIFVQFKSCRLAFIFFSLFDDFVHNIFEWF